MDHLTSEEGIALLSKQVEVDFDKEEKKYTPGLFDVPEPEMEEKYEHQKLEDGANKNRAPEQSDFLISSPKDALRSNSDSQGSTQETSKEPSPEKSQTTPKKS